MTLKTLLSVNIFSLCIYDAENIDFIALTAVEITLTKFISSSLLQYNSSKNESFKNV